MHHHSVPTYKLLGKDPANNMNESKPWSMQYKILWDGDRMQGDAGSAPFLLGSTNQD